MMRTRRPSARQRSRAACPGPVIHRSPARNRRGWMLWTRGKAYPQELRGRVLVARDEGGRVGQIAGRFKVSVSYVSKVISRREKSGETAARPQINHMPAKLADYREAIQRKLNADTDMTL